MDNKKAAIELSIGTIVIIVIAMSMLILGLVLVRNIFSGATESVDELNLKVKNEITHLFTEQNKDIIVKLGSGNTARIKQGTDFFGIGVGARTLDGSAADRNRLKYKLTLDKNGDCISKLGVKATEDLFITKLNTENSFDEFSGPDEYALIEVKIPKGTAICTQKVAIDVKDSKTNQVSGSFLKIDIIRSGFF